MLASDGVWEFLENEDVMKILVPYLNSNKEEAGLNEVIKQSVVHWKKEDVVIDDITIVLAVISHGENQQIKTVEANMHTQSHKDFKLASAYHSIPNFHMAQHY